MPLARHRRLDHPPGSGEPKVVGTVLGISIDPIERRVMEAMFIKNMKPQMNSKEEMVQALLVL